jgi:hypothetical protein
LRTKKNSAPVFAACKRLGWENLASSPFLRGWELDRLVQTQIIRAGSEEMEIRSRLAAFFSLPTSVAWVHANVDSIRSGPLTPVETTWLRELWSEL